MHLRLRVFNESSASHPIATMAEANADETVGQGERQEAPEMMESITKDELSPKRKYKFTGYVGASPSSLAAMAKGRQYFVDPYTPFTPRPEVVCSPRTIMCIGRWGSEISACDSRDPDTKLVG